MGIFSMKKICNMCEMCMGMQMMCEPVFSVTKNFHAKTASR